MGARRLGQDEQYLTVREILSEASTLADGALSRERILSLLEEIGKGSGMGRELGQGSYR